MSFNYQFHTVAGNLTKDVEATEKYASFDVALNVGFGEKKTVHYMKMTAFPKSLSEKMWTFLSGLKKGTNISVDYDEQDGSYVNKDGVKVRDVKRIVRKFQVIGERVKTEGADEGDGALPQSTKARTTSKVATTEDDSDPIF